MIEHGFWNNKKVFITGHTGFKGSWLCLWLHSLGANVTGYALSPPTDPSMFELCSIPKMIKSVTGDIRDAGLVANALHEAAPEIVFHLAAQSLVRDSYKLPTDTYSTNVMGTVNLLEAVRTCISVKAVINVTTDKCYENKEWYWGYRENEPLGGYDPYSSSKACSELVTASYRSSFFSTNQLNNCVALASARAGNVIGGGDWASDRLIPDCIRAVIKGAKIIIRNPNSIRPWQHVLEPLSGYLLLAQKLYDEGARYAEGWNFGPDDKDAKPVELIINKLCSFRRGYATYDIDQQAERPHEARFLKLDCSKAKTELGWNPRWNLDLALTKTLEWYDAYMANRDLLALSIEQIQSYQEFEREN